MLTPHRFSVLVGNRLGRDVPVRLVTRLCRHGRIRAQHPPNGPRMHWFIDPAEVERVAREGLPDEY